MLVHVHNWSFGLIQEFLDLPKLVFGLQKNNNNNLDSKIQNQLQSCRKLFSSNLLSDHKTTRTNALSLNQFYNLQIFLDEIKNVFSILPKILLTLWKNSSPDEFLSKGIFDQRAVTVTPTAKTHLNLCNLGISHHCSTQ